MKHVTVTDRKARQRVPPLVRYTTIVTATLVILWPVMPFGWWWMLVVTVVVGQIALVCWHLRRGGRDAQDRPAAIAPVSDPPSAAPPPAGRDLA
jgi:hypothetical protein